MVDAHVHLEKGDYNKEWLNEFIEYALARNIDEIYFLEHTHIFLECQNLYKEMSHYNNYQNQWYHNKYKNAKPIKTYTDFIEKIKKESFPIKLKFGLEVCYSPEHEEDIKIIKETYPFDFLVGAIHFMDGWAFSHKKQPWKKEDYNLIELYHRYYEIMYQLANCKLFSGVAHPNSLQCFGAYPVGDYSAEYDKIAIALKESDMYAEMSSGLAVNYGDSEIGMNQCMLKAMMRHNVQILTASDAHVPHNVGKLIFEMNQIIAKVKKE